MVATRGITDSRRAIVSILLPTHNAEQTMAACLRSIQRQSEPRWSCVIVDDGSTDGTRSIARRFAESDPRFRFFAQSHRGLVTALNAGLRLCVGPYVARMDADDLMHRERLREQVALLESRFDLAAVGCHVRIFPRQSLTEGARAYERWLNSIDSPESVRREAFIECPIAHPTLMIRRKCLAARGYREQGWPEDYDLVLRLLGDGRRIGVLPRRRLGWRDHPLRLSRTAETYGLDRFTACKAAFLAETLLAGSDVYDLWGYGETGRTLCRALERHGKRPRFIVEVHPGRLGNRIHGAEVIPPDRLGRPPGLPLLVSVAGIEPRTEIRRTLEAMGYREAEDFICTA
jgi:glycosyltransferase involved in cell wall biosynthesis